MMMMMMVMMMLIIIIIIIIIIIKVKIYFNLKHIIIVLTGSRSTSIALLSIPSQHYM